MEMEFTWNGTVDLKFVPYPIVSKFTAYSMNFLKLNTISICSEHSNTRREKVAVL